MLKNLNIKIYQELEDELEKLWINFEKESFNYCFQTYQWQRSWFKQMKKYKRKSISMHVIVVKNEEEILFILPFCIYKIFFFKVLSWSGFPFSDYNAPIINKNLNIDKDDFNLIWKLIIKKNKKKYNCISLLNQPETINNKPNPFFCYLKTHKTGFYSGINFKNSLIYKNNELSDIKYQKNRLNKIGNLQFKFAKDKNEKKKVLRFLIQNKIFQYEKTNAWNLFEINAFKKFFIQCNLKLNINLSYLTLDRKIIAAHSGYIYDQKYYYLFPTYDINFKKFSPGKILLYFLIDDCERKNLKYFDFTIGSEDYKKNWSNNTINSGMTNKSLNIIGFFYIFYIIIKSKLKSLNIKNRFLLNLYKKFKSSVSRS